MPRCITSSLLFVHVLPPHPHLRAPVLAPPSSVIAPPPTLPSLAQPTLLRALPLHLIHSIALTLSLLLRSQTSPSPSPLVPSLQNHQPRPEKPPLPLSHSPAQANTSQIRQDMSRMRTASPPPTHRLLPPP
ncbi:hypothetical protein BC938DRAFT_480730 [Jimgerdemannia flammicorona]|uniref:Uncharacterized protein n=1 Tax=Jimgerdemannia flammicorona TaxID=994334 RepID=A0A433QHT2_9FUNG|nr:hypothetical protein BC938DRAFT_480730 [Jimgerdemannia flammicorona]